MNFHRSLAGLFLVLLSAGYASAQDEPDMRYKDWPKYWQFGGGARTNQKRYAINVPAAVLGAAASDLHDLRLVDAAGKDIPYAVRVLRAVSRQDNVSITRVFNAGTDEKERVVEQSLELRLQPPRQEHNQIIIRTSGKNFRRPVEVFAADNEGFDKAQLLFKDMLVSVEHEGRRLLDINTFAYTPSTAKYLKVRVQADPEIDKKDLPKIEGAIVNQWIHQDGSYEEQSVIAGPTRDPVRSNRSPASAYLMELGTDLVPVEKLILQTPDTGFSRPYELEVLDDAEGSLWDSVAGGSLSRRGDADPLTINLSNQPEMGVRARRLRLVVTDFANPPLRLEQAKYAFAKRLVVFDPPPGQPLAEPLRLYFGNANAPWPQYDFAQGVPQYLDVAALPPILSSLEQNYRTNLAYVPPVPPKERPRWIIYAALSTASLVLLVLLALLARTALQRHDTTAQPAMP